MSGYVCETLSQGICQSWIPAQSSIPETVFEQSFSALGIGFGMVLFGWSLGLGVSVIVRLIRMVR